MRWAFRFAERRIIHGLPVGLLWSTESDRDVVFPRITDALDLIARYDDRRLTRLRQDIDGILVFGTVGAFGTWLRGARLVTLRLSYVLSPSITATEIAATLVHEGTHAWIERFAIPYDEPRRVRIERLCFESEIAFATRLPHPGRIIELAEHQLARDPTYWTNEAFRERSIQEVRELGVPKWLMRVLSLLTRRAA